MRRSRVVLAVFLFEGGAASQQLPDPLTRPPAPVDAGKPAALASDMSAAFSSPLKARLLADRVVVAVDQLATTIEHNRRTLNDLDSALAKAKERLANLPQERDRALKEYREGMFCSGCGQTRSQILAKGEQFPHAGQTIVRATAEQLAKKAAEYDRLIAEAKKRCTDLNEIRDRTASEAGEAISDVRQGLQLWQAAVSFELNLRAQQELDAQDDVKRGLLIIDEQEQFTSKSGKDSANHVWGKLRADLQSKDAARTTSFWQQVHDAEAHAHSNYVKLCGRLSSIQTEQDRASLFLALPPLPRLEVRTELFSLIVSPEEIGAGFRFGKVGSSGIRARLDRDAVSMEVQAFYEAYKTRVGVFSRLDMTRLGPRHSIGPVLVDLMSPTTQPRLSK